MDFRNVAGLTIPAGSVESIKIGNVTVWSKNANKYKILKDGVEVAEVTMSQFVSAIQSGAAQEDWGIGAQIVIPYHDFWTDKDYELPFNFGTFTAYGEGKLGLQVNNGVPTQAVHYGEKEGSINFCSWENSYAYKWLNAYNTSYGLENDSYYAGKTGFLGCIPKDFSNAIIPTYHGYSLTVLSKIFLLGLENLYISVNKDVLVNSENNLKYYVYPMSGDGENVAWDYWKNLIGTSSPLEVPQSNSNIIKEKIDKSVGSSVNSYWCTNKLKRTSQKNITGTFLQTHINSNGTLEPINSMSTSIYLPACVIG